MRILRVLLAFALVVTGVVTTVGSGGGGGSLDFDFGGPVPSLPPVTNYTTVDITTENARDVSATVVQAIVQLFDVATMMGGQLFPGLPAAPGLLPGNSKFKLFDAVLVSGGVTDACTVSGTVTVSGDPANDPVTISVNDEYDLAFDACDDGDGYVIDGSLSLKVMEVQGDPRTDVFRLRYLLLDIQLAVASAVDSYTASATGISLALDSLAFPVIILTPSPSSLRIGSQEDDYFWQNAIQTTLTVTAGMVSPATAIEAGSTRMESAFLGGNLRYETIFPLQTADDKVPDSGEILITGNGTIRIVIESITSVRLEIDADTDGIVDDYQYTTWAALGA